MDDGFEVVNRDGLIDLYFKREVVKTRTIVSYGDEPRRYMKMRGAAKYRGMYRSRRKVGFDRSVWTNDRSEAYAFDSPGAARSYIAKEFGKAAVGRYRFEAVKMVGVDRIYIPSANTDYGVERHHVSEFKEKAQ